MRERGVCANLRVAGRPSGKVGFGRAAGFLLLGEKESRRWEEVEGRRVKIREICCQGGVAVVKQVSASSDEQS